MTGCLIHVISFQLWACTYLICIIECLYRFLLSVENRILSAWYVRSVQSRTPLMLRRVEPCSTSFLFETAEDLTGNSILDHLCGRLVVRSDGTRWAEFSINSVTSRERPVFHNFSRGRRPSSPVISWFPFEIDELSRSEQSSFHPPCIRVIILFRVWSRGLIETVIFFWVFYIVSKLNCMYHIYVPMIV